MTSKDSLFLCVAVRRLTAQPTFKKWSAFYSRVRTLVVPVEYIWVSDGGVGLPQPWHHPLQHRKNPGCVHSMHRMFDVSLGRTKTHCMFCHLCHPSKSRLCKKPVLVGPHRVGSNGCVGTRQLAVFLAPFCKDVLFVCGCRASDGFVDRMSRARVPTPTN